MLLRHQLYEIDCMDLAREKDVTAGKNNSVECLLKL